MPGINALNPPPPLPVVPSWEGAPRPREDPGAVGPGPAREELQGSGPVLPGKPTWGAETICSLLEQADVAGRESRDPSARDPPGLGLAF